MINGKKIFKKFHYQHFQHIWFNFNETAWTFTISYEICNFDFQTNRDFFASILNERRRKLCIRLKNGISFHISDIFRAMTQKRANQLLFYLFATRFPDISLLKPSQCRIFDRCCVKWTRLEFWETTLHRRKTSCFLIPAELNIANILLEMENLSTQIQPPLVHTRT